MIQTKITSLLSGVLLVTTLGVFGQEKKEPSEYLFTNKIVIASTPIKNQQNTGTCWSYCTTSFIESELIRMGKPEIDLSEMFNVRMTYVEKAKNYYLRQGKSQFGEGGLSHDVMQSISKYGLVPESAYSGNSYQPGTHDHQEMAAILETTLKTIVGLKRPVSKVWMGNIDGTLNNYMGVPPTEFEFEGKQYSPTSFAKYLEIDANNYVTFTSFSHTPYYAPYIIQVPDNWSNGSFTNVPLSDLLFIIDDALANGYTIAWDADVSEKTWSRSKSIAILPETSFAKMSTEERSTLFTIPSTELVVTQKNRQELFESFQTTDDHLMHIVGTAIDQNNTPYYLVKNSWGDKRAFDGFVYVSKAYMAMKTIGIMVHTDAVPKSVKKQLK
ncbi:MAG: bleomycin hydrolase [Salibacteraceae bacterium]|jgi:bleomycin hydrolase